jgi:hypothetical protein
MAAIPLLILLCSAIVYFSLHQARKLPLVLFLFSIQILAIVVKTDKHVSLDWRLVFIPSYLVLAVFLIMQPLQLWEVECKNSFSFQEAFRPVIMNISILVLAFTWILLLANFYEGKLEHHVT